MNRAGREPTTKNPDECGAEQAALMHSTPFGQRITVQSSILKSVTTSFEMVSKTNNFRINNEIENLIKMSKVDFEK